MRIMWKILWKNLERRRVIHELDLVIAYREGRIATPPTISDIVLTCDRDCFRVCSCKQTPCEVTDHCTLLRNCGHLEAHIEERTE